MFRRLVSFPPRMYPVCFQSVGLCLTDEEIIMYLYAAGASLQFASQVVCVCLMANNSLLMLNWIVRGLNAPVRPGLALGGGKVGHRPGPPKTMGPHPKYKCTSNMPYMIHSDSVSQRRIGETNRRSRVGCDRLLSPNPACVPPPPWTGRRLDAFARRQLVRSFLCLNRQIAISLIATTAHSSVPESLLLLACCWTPELDRLCSKFQCEFTAFQRSS
jgi:hypothetical protein